MRRLTLCFALVLLALAATAVTASAASAPVITSVSPKQVEIGGTLIITGKNFKKGVSKNRVFFSRASDGKTVRVRPSRANSTRRLEVKVPAALDAFLTIKDGAAVATRFKIQVLSAKFSKKTATSNSPLIVPAGTAPASPNNTAPSGTGTTGTGATGTTGTASPNSTGTAGTAGSVVPPPPDCDADGTPDATDADDDNDGLSDALETAIHTNSCNNDTDGDGVEDGFEYFSARDLNGNALPYAGKRPYPNPLDRDDAGGDYDGDGLSQVLEFQAWNAYAGRALPAADGQTFPYSDGNQASPAADGPGAMDLNENGVTSDDEKDVDADGLPNWIELAKGEPDPVTGSGCVYIFSTGPNTTRWSKAAANIFTDCGLGAMPNANTFTGPVDGKLITGALVPPWLPNPLSWLDPDTDGDSVPDGADDQDFDGVSNVEEVTAGVDGYFTIPEDPCDPNPDARACPLHPSNT